MFEHHKNLPCIISLMFKVYDKAFDHGSNKEVSGKWQRLMLFGVIVVGFFFIFGAVLKALDIEGFSAGIAAYRVVKQESLVRTLSYVMILLEAGLGVALLLFPKRGIFSILTLLLLGFFSALILYSWMVHGLEDCGCLGSYIKMSPAASLVKNGVMAAMLSGSLIYWKKMASWNVGDSEVYQPRKAFFLVKGSAGVAATALFIIPVFQDLSRAVSEKQSTGAEAGQAVQQQGPFSRYRFETNDAVYDLSKGVFFICMFSDSCEHCTESVNEVNALVEDGGSQMPPVLALCLGEEDTLVSFRQKTSPLFPTFLIPPLEFFERIGTAPPRFLVVQDGLEIVFWDEEVPSFEEIVVHLPESQD